LLFEDDDYANWIKCAIVEGGVWIQQRLKKKHWTQCTFVRNLDDWWFDWGGQ
jgi:hypothetical protein